MDSTKLGKYSVLFSNKKEYHSIKREVWNQEIYRFDSEKNSPFIVDIGSHIGISLIYFKSLFPNSKILSFEPNPISFKILKENIQNNGFLDITPLNMAVCERDGTCNLYIDNSEESWHSNSSLFPKSWNGKENTKPVKVECTRLDRYLEDIDEIDMLKIDTEGKEIDILNSHKHILSKIQNISVEYHPCKTTKVERLISLLSPYFDLNIYCEGKSLPTPINGKLLTIQGKKRR